VHLIFVVKGKPGKTGERGGVANGGRDSMVMCQPVRGKDLPLSQDVELQNHRADNAVLSGPGKTEVKATQD